MASEAQRLLAFMNEFAKRLKQGNLPVFMRVVLFWCCYMAVLLLAWIAKAKVPPQWGQLVGGLRAAPFCFCSLWYSCAGKAAHFATLA
jgi:hypothetical protein